MKRSWLEKENSPVLIFTGDFLGGQGQLSGLLESVTPPSVPE
jgi:hypothetical protein